MARFLLVSLLGVVSLLAIQARQLSHSHAAPSSAEVFWHTVLPDSPLPEAIHWLLHPDTDSESTEVMNMGRAGDPGDNNAGRLSRFFFYPSYKHASQSPVGDSSAGLSRFFFYPSYKRSSQSPVGDSNAVGRLSRFFFYPSYKHSSQSPVCDSCAAGRLSRFFFYPSYKHSSQSPVGDNSAGSLSRVFFYPVYKRSSLKVASQNELVKGSVVFFHEEAVRVGETLPIFFPPAFRAPLGLLPRDVANSIPFATSALPGVLARFGIPAGSQQAADMEETLGMCEAPPLAGEAKFCATSLEALVEGAMAGLGTRDIRPVTSMLPRSGAPLQPYTIRAVHPIDGSRFVACHDDLYPYTVYMCHDTGTVRAYMADMEGANGSLVTVAIVCHTDTSLWDPEHMSFKLLGTKPGGEPVCHFMPYGHILFAANNNATLSAA